MHRRLVVVGALLLPLWATPATAQGLRDKVANLFRYGDCGEPLCLQTQGNGHGDHFIPSTVTGNSAIIDFITGAIGVNVANIPVPATSGGATFHFVNGEPVKTSVSAGPFIGERAQTLGRGRVLVGASVTSIKFTTLRGVRLSDMRFDFTHQDEVPLGLGNPDFENDVIRTRTSLDVHLTVTSVYLTYGLADAVDVGISVPLVNTSLGGRSVAQIDPFGPNPLHYFGGTTTDPILRATAVTEGSATGVGDVTVRAKVNLNQTPLAGLSLLADVHLPTGSEEDLLGSGNMSMRGLGIFSSRIGGFSPHVNLGYLHRSGERENSAAVATLGFDQLLAPWATFAFDLLTEQQVGDSKLTVPTEITFTSPFVRTVPATTIPNSRDHITNVSLGFKFTTSRSLTVLTNAIIPASRGGMRPDATWTVGLEYGF